MAETTVRKLLKKITVATCEATPGIEALIAYKTEHGDDAIMPLVSIFGICSGFRAGDSNGQPYVRFLGSFKAVRADGVEFMSGACILPGAAPDLLYGALNALGEAGGAVEFAFKIGAHFDESAVAKYVYDVSQVIETSTDDPIARLEAKLNVGAKAIAAPKKDAGKKGDAADKK